MGKRRRAREAAVQYHFWRDLQRGEGPDKIDEFWEFCPAPERVREFAQPLIEGMVAHLPDIDERIRRYCENYEFRRISAVDRNVLRLAIYEMLYRDDIPPVVSINEAIELAKAYGGADSGRFVNGILDRIRKDLDRPAREPVKREFVAVALRATLCRCGTQLQCPRFATAKRLQPTMNFLESLAKQFAGKPIDWDELEETLIRADLGVPMTMRIIKTLQEREAWALLGIGDVIKAVREEIARILPRDPAPIRRATGKPTVILIVGVNGTGKTTSTAKLARQSHRMRGPLGHARGRRHISRSGYRATRHLGKKTRR